MADAVFGFGAGSAGRSRRSRPSSGGTPTPTPSPSYTAGFTLTQFAAYEEKRVFQRATTAGGGKGKGAGTIRVPLGGTVTAGTVGARIRSAADGTTILQAEWSAGTISNGATYIDVSGIDARLGWFYVDLKGVSGSWQNGTVKVGMGALYGFAGQSLMARLFGRQDGQTATYASLGITPDANTAVLATYFETNAYNPTVATMPWQTPGDVGNSNGPNAAGIGVFLNKMVGLTGVNCGAFGHSEGGVAIRTFFAGQANWDQLASLISRAGGAFEGFVWGQGHGDSVYGLPAKAYQGALTTLFGQLTAANGFSGYRKLVWTIPQASYNGWGTAWQYNQVRKGAKTWADANSGTYVHMSNMASADGIHETQAGSVTMGEHMYRALRASYGASGGLGPAPVSATRSGTTITLTLSDVGQSTINLVGTPGNRIYVFPRGRVDRIGTSNNRFPVASVTVTNKTTLSITLANDPGVGHALDLYLYWPNDPANPTTDNLFDDRASDGDGIATGRILQANFTPIQIAAPTPGGVVNAPPGGFQAAVSPFNMVETSTSYASAPSGFGSHMTAGKAKAASDATPWFAPITIEGFLTCPNPVPSDIEVIVGGLGSGFIAFKESGKLWTDVLWSGSTPLEAGKRYHIAYQLGPNGAALYVKNITDGTAGARVLYDATPVTVIPGMTSWGLRNHLDSFDLIGGAVDEWAVFASERYSGASYTPPTTPFDGTEADLVALYRCDGDAKDAVGA